jgi:hypothetical protein
MANFRFKVALPRVLGSRLRNLDGVFSKLVHGVSRKSL